MSYAFVSDDFYDHPKAVNAGEDAADLYVRGLSYCRKHHTRGKIPKAALGKLTAKRTATANANALVRVVLWEDCGDHWQVHDYHHIYDDEGTLAQRARKAEYARELRRKKRGATAADGSRPGATAGVDAYPERTGYVDGTRTGAYQLRTSDVAGTSEVRTESPAAERPRAPTRADALSGSGSGSGSELLSVAVVLPVRAPGAVTGPARTTAAAWTIDPDDALNALMAAGVNMAMGPGLELGFRRTCASLGTNGFTLDDFAELGAAIRDGTADWFDGEWNARTLMGKPDGAGEFAAYGLIRALEAVRDRRAKRERTAAPPVRLVPPPQPTLTGAALSDGLRGVVAAARGRRE